MIFSTTPKPELVEAGGDVPESFAAAAVRAGVVAWDIETTGLEWSSERIATCQLATPDGKCVLVAKPEASPTNLLRLLSDKRVEKVFHHALFDLRFMAFHWKAEPRNIACTKIASKLLNPSEGTNHSLKTLLNEHLGITIDKALQKSDWMREDLTPAQIAYAVADVLYLPELLGRVRVLLQRAGLAELYQGCLEHIPTRVKLDIGRYPDVYAY
jgi:ribonuclease D